MGRGRGELGSGGRSTVGSSALTAAMTSGYLTAVGSVAPGPVRGVLAAACRAVDTVFEGADRVGPSDPGRFGGDCRRFDCPPARQPYIALAMDTLDRIEQTLDSLRPYIASHRGSVEVVDFDEGEGVLTLRLGGTCHGCAASTITLRQGIETRLRQFVPEVKVVQAL